MSEGNGFILKAEMYNQEEWYQMYLSMLKVCKELQQENQSLKKQKEEWINLLNMSKKQQKEFIDWLENEMEKNINWYNSLTPYDKNYYYKDYVDKDTNYMVVLSKYKEIIGDKDE